MYSYVVWRRSPHFCTAKLMQQLANFSFNVIATSILLDGKTWYWFPSDSQKRQQKFSNSRNTLGSIFLNTTNIKINQTLPIISSPFFTISWIYLWNGWWSKEKKNPNTWLAWEKATSLVKNLYKLSVVKICQSPHFHCDCSSSQSDLHCPRVLKFPIQFPKFRLELPSPLVLSLS